jgi:hypothetical protein
VAARQLEPALITLDTSAIYALLDAGDASHERVRDAFLASRGPRVIPAGILGEAAFLFESRLGAEALDVFLSDIESGAFALDCGEEDLARIRRLVARYADLPLGFADASVIACAERRGGAVLTLDVRDFGVVAREGTIALLPV